MTILTSRFNKVDKYQKQMQKIDDFWKRWCRKIWENCLCFAVYRWRRVWSKN